ncbi:MAG: hypothetical protein MJK04_20685, partial [Psychrosphaera sp.]|nr:hypothetical protein [Psychrosphaera sp.]
MFFNINNNKFINWENNLILALFSPRFKNLGHNLNKGVKPTKFPSTIAARNHRREQNMSFA